MNKHPLQIKLVNSWNKILKGKKHIYIYIYVCVHIYVYICHKSIAALESKFLELSQNGNGYKGLTLKGDASCYVPGFNNINRSLHS